MSQVTISAVLWMSEIFDHGCCCLEPFQINSARPSLADKMRIVIFQYRFVGCYWRLGGVNLVETPNRWLDITTGYIWPFYLVAVTGIGTAGSENIQRKRFINCLSEGVKTWHKYCDLYVACMMGFFTGASPPLFKKNHQDVWSWRLYRLGENFIMRTWVDRRGIWWCGKTGCHHWKSWAEVTMIATENPNNKYPSV